VIEFVRGLMGKAVEDGGGALRRDSKTLLQEWGHSTHRITPVYRTVHDSEIEEDERRFAVEVYLGDKVLGSGLGRSKRLAERAAAAAALRDVDADASQAEAVDG
jgi:ribonuclease-3